MADRAILFIDGNNWYHALRDVGVSDLGRLDYAAVSRKLVGPRIWLATRYYIGRVSQGGNRALYADQRRFLSTLISTDPRITTHLGRLEPRPFEDPAADELNRYLAELEVRIDRRVYHDLLHIAQEYRNTTVIVEKAVDVMIAVDMVAMAVDDQYDAAYLLSADGDFTPDVRAVKGCGKKVYAVSTASGAQLAAVVDSFIRLSWEWFADCYR